MELRISSVVDARLLLTAASHARSKISKRVNFSENSWSSKTLVLEDSTSEFHIVKDTLNVELKPSKIQNLCSQFQRAKDREEKLGFIETKEQQYEIYNVRKHIPLPSVSLREILSDTTASTQQQVITRMEQLQLAAILASTLLQLQTTPWLNQSWGKEDIEFLHPEDRPLASRAYVSAIFSTSNIETPGNHPIIRNKAIFALGIILIELSEGKPRKSTQNLEARAKSFDSNQY